MLFLSDSIQQPVIGSYDMACCQECVGLAAACLLSGEPSVERAAFQRLWQNKLGLTLGLDPSCSQCSRGSVCGTMFSTSKTYESHLWVQRSRIFPKIQTHLTITSFVIILPHKSWSRHLGENLKEGAASCRPAEWPFVECCHPPATETRPG